MNNFFMKSILITVKKKSNKLNREHTPTVEKCPEEGLQVSSHSRMMIKNISSIKNGVMCQCPFCWLEI